MDGRSLRTVVGRGFGIALAVGAAAGLLYVASIDETAEGDGPTYWESLAVVSLVGLGAWAALAARSHVRGQDASIMERIPPQPGDASDRTSGADRSGEPDDAAARRSTRGAEPAAGSVGRAWRAAPLVAGASVADRLSAAPAELAELHGAVRAAAASEEAYEERLRPRLRALAAARAATAGRSVDVDAVTELRVGQASIRIVHRLLMRLPCWRRSVRIRAIARVIRTVEEQNDGNQQGTRAL